MNLKESIRKRRSVRKYQDKPVPDNIVKEIIELARRAPSAGGLRGYKVFVTNQKMTNQIDAPLYLVVCADPEKYAKGYGDRGRNLYSVQDATIFGAYIQLLAVDYGLATVWVGAFVEGRVRRALKTELRPIVILCLGYELQ